MPIYDCGDPNCYQCAFSFRADTSNCSDISLAAERLKNSAAVLNARYQSSSRFEKDVALVLIGLDNYRLTFEVMAQHLTPSHAVIPSPPVPADLEAVAALARLRKAEASSGHSATVLNFARTDARAILSAPSPAPGGSSGR